MANTRQLKRRIGSANNIAKITKAMEMVAASKMKRAQEQALEARPYSRALQASLRKIAAHTDEDLHPLLSHHATGVEVLIIVSTEKGLCGSLNTNLFKQALAWKGKHPNGKVVVIGRKAVAFSRFAGWDVLAQFTDVPETVSSSDIVSITQLVKEQFLRHEIKSVDIVYTDFINTLSQKTTITQLLPIRPDAEFTEEKMIAPDGEGEYTFEPDAEALLNYLLPYYIENSMYQIMLESRASEHSARMVAMKNASENATDLVGELKLLFNKTRQADITSELLDITTATLSLQ